MKKVRLILACLITVACFSAFVISCKKSSSDDDNNGGGNGGGSSIVCTCTFVREDGSSFTNNLSMDDFSSCAAMASWYEQYSDYAHVYCD